MNHGSRTNINFDVPNRRASAHPRYLPILDGYLEHDAHASRNTGRENRREEIRFVTALCNPIKNLEQII